MLRPPLQDYVVLLSLWLLTFCQTSQFIIVVPILPEIGRELGIAPDLQGTLITVYGLCSALLSVISGPISDRVGRKRMLLLGTAGMAVALFLHPLAHSYWVLLGMRALAGLASGVLSGAAIAYVGDYFPYNRRGWANGWVMSGLAVGQVLGIPAGTVLADAYGFSAPFVGFGILLAVNVVVLALFVPQPNVVLESRLTVTDALKKYAYLFTHADSTAATVAFLVMFLSVSTFVTFLPTWLEEVHGATKGQVAAMYAAGGVAAVIGNPVAGRLSDRIGRRGIILWSCTGFLVMQVITPYVLFRLEVAYVLFFITMIFASMRMAPLQSLVTAIVTPERRGTLLGLTSASGSVGFAIGGALAGYLYGHRGFEACAAVGAVAVAATIGVIGRYLPEPMA